MRGKVPQAWTCPQCRRITPAYAGKRFSFSVFIACVWDHPRLCGEKLTVAIYSHLFSGSPPPMRGKDFPNRFPTLTDRITPAYAGKRFGKCSVVCLCQDHPRLCGEKPKTSASNAILLGSPPPMRGKGDTRQDDGAGAGITPAYAGKSPQSLYDAAQERDHPRLCGEKST